MRTAAITGVNGQDGSYLAELLIEQGYRVIGLIRPDALGRCERIAHLAGGIELMHGDLRDDSWLRHVLLQHRPTAIYNLAARASSAQLFDEPLATADANGMAAVRILEAIRTVDPAIRYCQASSSEMFGNAMQSPQGEATPFRPRNPYGVAKLFAHGMVGTYREHFGMFACSSVLFNHESPRRSVEHVTRKITRAVARIKSGLDDSMQLGNLEATRDWGYAPDYVRAMWLMLQAPIADDYVVATGESHSVREFCDIAFTHVGLDYRDHVRSDPRAQRPAEGARLVGDASKAMTNLGWAPSLSFEQLVHVMVDADIEVLSLRLHR